MNEYQLDKIIIELCEEMGIKIKKLSYDWILELTKGDKKIHIVGNKFGLNSENSQKIASDKYATYEVLKNVGIPIIEYTMLFNPQKRSEYTSKSENKKILINEYIKNKNLVVKPNDGSSGKRSIFSKKH